MPSMPGTIKVVKDAKVVQIDDRDPTKIAQIGANVDPK
jgi:hypothetical protein